MLGYVWLNSFIWSIDGILTDTTNRVRVDPDVMAIMYLPNPSATRKMRLKVILSRV